MKILRSLWVVSLAICLGSGLGCSKHEVTWGVIGVLFYPIEAPKQGRTVSVRGEIVDQDGTLLDDVTMTVTSNAAHVPSRNKAAERVDKTFAVTRYSCRSFGIRFEKDGYYSKNISGDVARMYVKGRVERSQSIDGGIRVVLWSKVTDAPLARISQPLPLQAGPETTAIDLTEMMKNPTQYYRDHNRQKERPLRMVPTAADEAAVPPNLLWATAEVDQDTGDLAVVHIAQPRGRHEAETLRRDRVIEPDAPSVCYPELPPGRRRSRAPMLKELRLHISGPGAGFVFYGPKDEYYDVWREMRKAPAEGYSPVLSVTPARAMRWSRRIHRDGIYFYVRTAQGRYGKGHVTVHYDGRSKRHRAHVLLYIRPDGQRDVQSNGKPKLRRKLEITPPPINLEPSPARSLQ